MKSDVLHCAPQAIKERQLELGAVDHSGISMRDLNDLQPSWWSKLVGKKNTRNEKCAVILDMWVCKNTMTAAVTAYVTELVGPPSHALCVRLCLVPWDRA